MLAMHRIGIFIWLVCSLQVQARQQPFRGLVLDQRTAEAITAARLSAGGDTVHSGGDGRFMLPMHQTGSPVLVEHAGYNSRRLVPAANSGFQLVLLQANADAATAPIENTRNGSPSTDTVYFNSPAIRAYQQETYKKEQENPFVATATTPYTAFALKSGHASYNNIRRFLTQHKRVPPASVRIGEMLNYFTLDDPLPIDHPEQPLQAQVDMSVCPWNTAHWLMRVAVQASPPDTLDRPWNLVLLVDVSGSMGEPDKLPLLQIALRQLAMRLRAEDTLAMIVYADTARLILPPVSGAEQDRILRTIETLRAGGATAGSKGIAKAFALAAKRVMPEGNNRVILATDGDFNVGATSDAEMKKLMEQYHQANIGLTCIGLGSGNYKDSKLETLTRWGQGTFVYIDGKAEALRVFNEGAFSRMHTVARNVRLKVVFDPGQIGYFRLTGFDSGGKNAARAFSRRSRPPGATLSAGGRLTAYFELAPLQSRSSAPAAGTLILQYEGPQAEQSFLQWHQIPNRAPAFHTRNADWRFGASVVLLGMLLRGSDYIGQGSFAMAEQLAKRARDAVAKSDYKAYRNLLHAGWKATRP